MEFDNIYGIDMDDFNLLYYIGGLGKSTNDLPMSGTISGYTMTGTWTIDNANRATRGEFSNHTLTWNWDDQGGGNTPQSSGVFQGPQRIFGNNRVKSFDVEGYSHSDFIYDDKGFLSKIKMNQYVYDGDNEPGNYDATFEYNEDGIVGKSWINGSLFRTIPIPIGSNGFQTSVVYDNDKWTYTYDEDGQMTEILYSYIGGNGESHSERITLTWENGDIVQQKVYIGNQDPIVTNITYSTFDTSAIENLAGVMEFIESMHIELEAMYYYAGFLGKGTKHLPLSWNNTNGNSGKNTWTLDDAGRVVKLVTEKNAWGNTTTKTFSVKWEGDESLQSSLLGTWYTIWPSTDLTEIQGYAFNSDGTATGFEGKLRQSDNYSPTHAEQYNCYYTLSGNTLTIRDIDNTDTYTISLNNDGTITFLDSRGRADIYTRLPEDKTPLQFYQEMAESLR